MASAKKIFIRRFKKRLAFQMSKNKGKVGRANDGTSILSYPPFPDLEDLSHPDKVSQTG